MRQWGLAWIVAVWGAVPALGGTAALVGASPFLPPDFRAEPAAPVAAPTASNPLDRLLDFKGFYQINGEYRLLLSPKRGANGGWLRVGEAREDIEVLDFDVDAQRVRARFQGSEGWLDLARMESNTSGAPASPTPASPTEPSRVVRPPGTTPPVTTPISPPRPPVRRTVVSPTPTTAPTAPPQ
jgi:hypothetical protein